MFILRVLPFSVTGYLYRGQVVRGNEVDNSVYGSGKLQSAGPKCMLARPSLVYDTTIVIRDRTEEPLTWFRDDGPPRLQLWPHMLRR